MITKFKIFENVNKNDITEYKYVVFDISEGEYEKNYTLFVNSHIARIFETDDKKIYVHVRFCDIGDLPYDYSHSFRSKLIKHIADNKEDLEVYIKADKFNL